MDQAELTPALERVAASVVETHRKRQQVEEDLKAATAAVASLHTQSSSLEASVVELRRELEQALQVRTQENAALAEIAAKRTEAAGQLAAIAHDIETFLADKERSATEIAAQGEAARSKLQSVQGEVAAVKTALTAFTSDASALRDKLASIRKSADVAEGQLGEVQSKARELDGAVDSMAAKVCGIADALEHADRDRQRVVTASDEMRAVTAALEVRKAEAQKANAETEKLLSEKGQETKTLAQQIERLSQLSAGSEPVANAQPRTDAAPPPVSPRTDAAPPPVQPRTDAAPPLVQPRTDAAPPPAQPRTDAAPLVGERRSVERRSATNGAYKFAQTVELTGVLVPLGFIAHDEADAVLEMLREGDVDKFVRSLWSRAMGGPLPGPYRLIIGSALIESGDHKGAMTFFNKALEGRHVDPFMTYLVAVALLRMKRYVDVLRIAQGLGRARNGKVLSRNVEGLHLAASGRVDEAEKKLAEALTIPGHPRLHYNETMYNLARLAEGRGDASTAAQWFEKVAAADASFRDVALHMDSLKTEAHLA